MDVPGGYVPGGANSNPDDAEAWVPGRDVPNFAFIGVEKFCMTEDYVNLTHPCKSTNHRTRPFSTHLQ